MTDQQRELLLKAEKSLQAAKHLLSNDYPDYAASRAYYSIVISDNNETIDIALYPPTPFSQKGRKGSKRGMGFVCDSPLSLFGRGVGGEGSKSGILPKIFQK